MPFSVLQHHLYLLSFDGFLFPLLYFAGSYLVSLRRFPEPDDDALVFSSRTIACGRVQLGAPMIFVPSVIGRMLALCTAFVALVAMEVVVVGCEDETHAMELANLQIIEAADGRCRERREPLIIGERAPKMLCWRSLMGHVLRLLRLAIGKSLILCTGPATARAIMSGERNLVSYASNYSSVFEW